MSNGTEALAAIVAGLKGVTPGPWWADSERSEGGDGTFNAFAVYGPETRYGHPSSICDTHNSGEIMIERDGDDTPWDEQGRVNMEHIARCDPDTMRAIASDIATKDAEIARLREALEFYSGIHEPGLSNPNEGPWGVNSTDFGEVARAALYPAPDPAGGMPVEVET